MHVVYFVKPPSSGLGGTCTIGPANGVRTPCEAFRCVVIFADFAGWLCVVCVLHTPDEYARKAILMPLKDLRKSL